MSDVTPQLPMTEAQQVAARKRALLAKVKLLEDRSRKVENLLKDPDPAYAYVWVYNHQQRIDFYRQMEFRLVDKSDKVSSEYKRPDGTHVRGDTILMKCPRDLQEAWNASRELNAIEQMEGRKTQFGDWAAQSGVPIVG